MNGLKRFLVTAANGDLAEAVGGVLLDAYPSASLHATEAGAPWPGMVTFEFVHRVPLASAPNYVSAVTAIVEKIGAASVIPCHDAELLRFATDPQAKDLPLLAVQPSLIECFTDKLLTAQWLVRHGLPAPRTVPLVEARAQDLPAIVKPRRGSGSSGVHLVRDHAHLQGLKSAFGDSNVAQAFLDGEDTEFTCVVVRLLGEVRTLVLKRRLGGGRTVEATVADVPEAERLLGEVAEAADLDGVINVQLRLTRRGPMVFEINPRFSSTVKMRHLIGFKDLVWALDARRGIPPPPFTSPVGTTIFRLSREVVRPAHASSRCEASS